jgi:hypothetical protein
MIDGIETLPRAETRETATSVSRKQDIESNYPVTREPTTDSADETENHRVQTLSPPRRDYNAHHYYHDDIDHNHNRSRQNSTHSHVSEHSKRHTLEHGRPVSVLNEHEYTKTTTVADEEAGKKYVVVGATPSEDPGIVFGRGLDTPVGGGFTVCHVVILFVVFLLFIVLLAVLV